MIILGINETSHDASVSLIENGNILFAAHAERYSKVKNDWYINQKLINDAFNYGKKVIATGYGGQVDFLGNDHIGLVKYKIDKVSGMDSFSTNYSSDQEWAYPDLNHAYELMLYFYEN